MHMHDVLNKLREIEEPNESIRRAIGNASALSTPRGVRDLDEGALDDLADSRADKDDDTDAPPSKGKPVVKKVSGSKYGGSTQKDELDEGALDDLADLRVNAGLRDRSDPSVRHVSGSRYGGGKQRDYDGSSGRGPRREVPGSTDMEFEELDEYANSPNLTTHTSTTQMFQRGSDLNRPKKQTHRLANRGDNPMTVENRLWAEYQQMKSGVI